jgi:formylglycine-generating enzyme required for sulfatase activity
LPTEAEWEYACRAGTTGDYAGDLDAMAWYGNNSGDAALDAEQIWRTDQTNYFRRIMANNGRVHPVGQKKLNAWGLFDMHGNVREWCQDWYDQAFYGRSPGTDPVGPSSGSDRGTRGGG